MGQAFSRLLVQFGRWKHAALARKILEICGGLGLSYMTIIALWRLNNLVRGRPNAASFSRTATLANSIMRSLISKHLANMVMSSVGLTYVATKLGIRRAYSAPVFFSLVWALHYRFAVIETAKLRFRRTFWNVHVVEKARLAKIPYRPLVWGFNGHMMTAMFTLLSEMEFFWQHTVKWRRETIPAYDGNPVLLDWVVFYDSIDDQFEAEDDAPIILISHGIAGDRHEPYMKRISTLCHRVGWRPVVFTNWRLDFGEHRDLQVAVEHIQATHPRAPIVAVAYSAGCHILLSYLQRVGKDTPIVAAITVSGTANLMSECRRVQQEESLVYQKFLHNCLIRCGRRHLEEARMPLNRAELQRIMATETVSEVMYDRFLDALPSHSSSHMAHAQFTSALADAARIHSAWQAHGHSDVASSVGTAATADTAAAAADAAAAGAGGGSGRSRNRSSGGGGAIDMQTTAAAIASNTGDDVERGYDSSGGDGGGDGDGYSSDGDGSGSTDYRFMSRTAAHYSQYPEHHFSKIQVSLLMLHAEDDPIVCDEWVRLAAASGNKHIITATTKRGGHVAWFEGWLPLGRTWADRMTIEYISAVLEAHSHTNFLVNVFRTTMRQAPLDRRGGGGGGGGSHGRASRHRTRRGRHSTATAAAASLSPSASFPSLHSLSIAAAAVSEPAAAALPVHGDGGSPPSAAAVPAYAAPKPLQQQQQQQQGSQAEGSGYYLGSPNPTADASGETIGSSGTGGGGTGTRVSNGERRFVLPATPMAPGRMARIVSASDLSGMSTREWRNLQQK